jgi:hypothetical protein
VADVTSILAGLAGLAALVIVLSMHDWRRDYWLRTPGRRTGHSLHDRRMWHRH